jgi:hypothetical protein
MTNPSLSIYLHYLRFLDKLSDQELNRCAEIAERSEGGIAPTQEEQSFLDDLEAKYGAT